MEGERDITLRAALAGYFADNGFGADGGYGDAWVDFSLGPLPFPFPNTEGRKRAVRFHDLHHLVTGYPTDTVGELTISAWEIGAGCGDFYAAWVINLSGMGLGALVAPSRVFRAFVRGRGSRTFYGEVYEEVLEERVADARAARVRDRAPTLGDRALFAAGAAVGCAVATVFAAAALPLLPLGLFNLWRKRRATAPAGVL
ncbi:MAG: hypothetical protein IPQ09_16860 [Myxococcales bacterium]|nr:hypothetical protein [Myxococcales bacterium]HQY64936.1 hypothetical protein [Polyangiaceae bacterium]